MTANEALKPLGALSVFILTIGLLLVVRFWSQGLSKTFSQHVATSKKGIVYYTLLFTIVLPLLLVFFIGWFVPTFQLSSWFTVFLVVATTTQYLCTLIPETGGIRSQYHRFLAGLSALALIPVVTMLMTASTVSVFNRTVASVSLLCMVGIIAILVAKRAEHKYFLLLQSLYFAAFFVTVLSMTYVR